MKPFVTEVDAVVEAWSLRFSQVRGDTEELARPLSAEDQTVQSMPDVSPTKWHRAHVTWFFETFVLAPHEPGFRPFHPDYSYLFNSYYEQVGERFPRPQRGLVTRPGIDEISRYRRDVDERVLTLIQESSPETLTALAPLIELGLHHEQQHQELLLMDIKHVLSLNPLEPAYVESDAAPAADPGPLGWVEVPGGVVEIGLAPGSGRFGFDNEGPRHEVLLRPYRLADRLVTCGEWLEFMADGGYHRPELWLSDGWYLRRDQGWEAPLYWRDEGDCRRLHTLGGTRTVDPHEPVAHVSFYEADAYATWAGRRLATEFEWEHAAANAPVEESPRLHPAGADPAASGLRQLFGNCWQWTESAYRPYPGFRPVDGAIGEYNGKFMINTMVLRGSCAFTPRGHARSTYRNFFHPHTRWHLSGVRLAADS